jgi:hypothetical protein
MYKNFSLENLKGRDRSKDLGVDGRIILEWIWGNSVGRYGLDACGSGWVAVTGSCSYGNEPSGSIRGGRFLEWVTNYYLLKDSAPWNPLVL